MHTELITWYTPAERLPDADLTVLVRMPEGWDEPVTQGWLDGEQWREAASGAAIPAPLLWTEGPTGEARRAAVTPAQPVLDGVEQVSDADNQWFGDMMILQVLADSDNVNEQEREVLTRWMAASDRPTSRTRPGEAPHA